jgi:hypothetical protein
MSKPPLSDRTKKQLLELARRRGVAGAEGLSKDALVKALSAPPKATAKATKASGKPSKPAGKPIPPNAKQAASKPVVKPVAKPAPIPVKPAVAKSEPAAKPTVKPTTTVRVEAVIPADKDLSTKPKNGGPVKDRIVVTAPDAYWLHAFWELSTQSVQRAEAALGQEWHGAKPIIRLFDVTSQDTTSTSEAPVRDIVLHGGCNRWYIDVPQPPRSYRADIGYLTRSGRFFPLCRSNVVAPPKAGASEAMEDGNWSEGDRPAAAADGPAHGRDLPDDQFRRPLKDTPFGSGAVLPGKLKKFFFDIDAELIVYVKTDPAATVTLQNDGVKLKPDGTAVMRFSLPDSRQIIPAVATSADGMEEQTIVLAVERNTKRLDPMIHDLYGEN